MTAYASRTGPRPSDKPAYVRGQPNASGYVFGSGLFRESAKIPEARRAIVVEGISSAPDGYEVLAEDGTVVVWFHCVVDALVVRRAKDLAKVVRCSDRALITAWSRPVRVRA